MPSDVTHDIDEFESLLLTVQDVLGVVVPDAQRSNLLERVNPLLSLYDLDSVSSLAAYLRDNESDEIRSVMLDAVSKTQLSWGLNTELKTILNKYIFSQLPNHANVWVVGCGQGELAYSIVMEAEQFQHESGEIKQVQFLASDVSPEDIKRTESSLYKQNQLSGLTEEYKALYMTSSISSGELMVKERIREKIKFSVCDLTEDFQSLGKMDLIICPSALVYFSNDLKAAVIGKYAKLLNAGGILLTGENQILTSNVAGLERVEHSAGVFYRQTN